jgi:hypothetical protein
MCVLGNTEISDMEERLLRIRVFLVGFHITCASAFHGFSILYP